MNLRQQRGGPNRLERAGATILRSVGVAFGEQVLLGGKFVVDALIGGRIVVQWDGDYWHGYRTPGDLTPLSRRQSRRTAIDQSQDKYLTKCGYRVLRFWEHEVHKTPEVVREAIEAAVRQAAA